MARASKQYPASRRSPRRAAMSESLRREPHPLCIGHGADDVAPAAEIVAALSALAGGKDMRQRIEGRERRLEPPGRAPDQAEAHEGIYLALPIAQGAGFGADCTQKRVRPAGSHPDPARSDIGRVEPGRSSHQARGCSRALSERGKPRQENRR